MGMTPKLIQLANLPRVMLVKNIPSNDEIEKELGIFGHDERLTESEFKNYILKVCHLDNWRIVSTLSEVTEEWCKGVAPFCPVGSGKYMDWTIKHTDCMECNTALESFHSAIEAEGYYVLNPFQHPKELNNYGQGELPPYLYQEDLKVWQEFQSKTLPANTLILEMI